MTVNLFADSESIAATGTQVADIGALAARALTRMNEINALTSRVHELQVELRQLLENDLPDAMDAANCKEFQTSDGHKLTIKDVVAASIPKIHQEAALQWLRDNGHASLIKHEITLPMAKGMDNLAPELIDRVKRTYGIDAEDKSVVHPQTLAAFCREQLAHGKELPADLLGLYVNRIVHIK